MPQGTVSNNLVPDRLADPVDCRTFGWKAQLCVVMSCTCLRPWYPLLIQIMLQQQVRLLISLAMTQLTDTLRVEQQWSYRQVLDLPKYASTPSPLTPAGL